MTSLLDEPRDRRRRKTRAALIASATRLWSSAGYRTTSVEALAEDADIALTSLYGNFPGGKAELYAVLACHTARAHSEQMAAQLTGMTGAQAAEAALGEYIRFHRENPLAFRLLGLSDVAGSPESDIDTPQVSEARAFIRATLAALADSVARHIDHVSDPLGAAAAEIYTGVLLAWAGINGILALRERGLIGDERTDELLDAARLLHLQNLEVSSDADR